MKINYKKSAFLLLRYISIAIGILSLIYFWQVSLSKIGFWNFSIGIGAYLISQGVANSIKNSNVVKYG